MQLKLWYDHHGHQLIVSIINAIDLPLTEAGKFRKDDVNDIDFDMDDIIDIDVSDDSTVHFVSFDIDIDDVDDVDDLDLDNDDIVDLDLDNDDINIDIDAIDTRVCLGHVCILEAGMAS